MPKSLANFPEYIFAFGRFSSSSAKTRFISVISGKVLFRRLRALSSLI